MNPPFKDYFNPVNYEYLTMDPHQLDQSELAYELKLRNFNVRGTPRQQATQMADQLAIARVMSEKPVNLSISPLPIDTDIHQSEETCSLLEDVAKTMFVDSPTLMRSLQRARHLMARLARIDVNECNAVQAAQLERLQRRTILVRCELRYKQNPNHDPQEIYDSVLYCG